MTRASFWILLTSGLLVGGIVGLHRWLAPPQLGQMMIWLVLLYHLLLVGGAWLRSHHELIDAWLFLAPLSLCQVMPDSMLVQVFGVLVFPDLGAERIAGVPLYMAGLWVCPLLLVIWFSSLVNLRSGVLAVVAAALSAVAIFGVAEWQARPLSIWVVRNVFTVNGVAPYVLAPEAALGVAAWLMWVKVQSRALPLKWLGAAVVSVFYAGALVAALLVERRF
jgi:hypothetical protein